jgi:hypothetical protein
MQRKTGTIRVETPDGRVDTVVEYTEFIEAPSFEGTAYAEGLKTYVDRQGRKLNVTADGIFEDRLTGQVYRRI